MQPAAVTPRSFWQMSVRLDGVADVIILLALVGSWLGLLGGWHWALDLFSHFRWQYLVVSVLALAWTLWRKRRAVAVASALTFLLNAWLIGRLALDTAPPAMPGGHALRVVSLNVLTSNNQTDRVLNFLKEADADIIFLMEVDHKWALALQPLAATHPHHLLHDRRDNFGVALFSRLPLQSLEILSLKGASMPSLEAHLTHEGREIVLVGTHPLPPVGLRRDHQLTAVRGHIAGLKKPILLVGDLNATPWSHGMRLLMADGRLGYRSPQAPCVPTWRTRSIFAIPIDHALCTHPLVISRHEVGPDVGSDHCPLIIEIGWETKA